MILAMLIDLQFSRYRNRSTWLDCTQPVNVKPDAANQTIKPPVRNDLLHTTATIEQTRQNYFLERRTFM